MWVSLLNSMLVKLFRTGDFHLTLHDGSTVVYGDGTAPSVHVRLTNADLPRRILRNPELAVGEAYMDGQLIIEKDDLHGFLTLGQQNLRGRRLPGW
ncbi:MAG: DUF7884 domain-containing protein [Paracoccaceae bacterium]